MSILSSLRSWMRRSGSRRQRRTPSRPRLGVEQLESRTCCTTNVLAGGNATLTVGPNMNTGHMAGDQSETAVAINPNNPSDIFVAANDNATFPGMYASFTTDGGATWHPRVMADGVSDTLPAGFTDPWASWDHFGNLFFTYIDATGTLLIVTLSTDGGQSFTNIAQLAVTDQPKITTGDNMVWVTYNNPTAGGDIQAAGARVFGLGIVGAFSAPEAVPGSVNGNFGDIAISPNGQIMVTYENAASGVGPDAAMISVDPDGLGPLGFSAPTVATTTNVGSFRPIPAQPVRTIDAALNLAWDSSGGPYNNRVYLCYSDATSTTSNDITTYIRYSDNNGLTWSNRVKVNDDTDPNSHFFPKVAVDQSTGNVAVAWYDCRNDPNNVNVEVFASASLNGGVTFLPNVQVAAGFSNAIIDGDNGGNDFGDYMALGFTFAQGAFYPVWTDNSSSLPGNTDLPTFDIATARVQLSFFSSPVYYPLRFIYNPQTTIYSGLLTFYNLGPNIQGPITVIFYLPAGINLVDPTGFTASGLPYITLSGPLASENNLRLLLELTDPNNLPLTTYFIGFPVKVFTTPFDPTRAGPGGHRLRGV